MQIWSFTTIHQATHGKGIIQVSRERVIKRRKLIALVYTGRCELRKEVFDPGFSPDTVMASIGYLIQRRRCWKLIAISMTPKKLPVKLTDTWQTQIHTQTEWPGGEKQKVNLIQRGAETRQGVRKREEQIGEEPCNEGEGDLQSRIYKCWIPVIKSLDMQDGIYRPDAFILTVEYLPPVITVRCKIAVPMAVHYIYRLLSQKMLHLFFLY